MRPSEAIFIINSRLGGADGLEMRIRAEMQYVQSTEEGRDEKPWFLLQKIDDSIDTRGQINLPKGFLRELEDGVALAFNNEDGTVHHFAVKRPFEEIEKLTLDEDKFYYDIVGNELLIRPRPAAQVPVTFRFYQRDKTIQVDEENGWLREAADVIIGGAGMAIAQYAEMPQALALFQQQFVTAVQRLQKETVQRRMTNLELTRKGVR